MSGHHNNPVNEEELRRPRREESELLRLERLAENLERRRNIFLDRLHFGVRSPPLNLNEIIMHIFSQSPATQLIGLQAAREMLTTSPNMRDRINDIINSGLVDRIVQLLATTNNTELTLQALWVLANVASGTSNQTRTITESGAVEHFLRLLSSTNSNVAEMSCFALANVIGDGGEERYRIVSSDLILILAGLLQHNQTLVSRTVAWTILNIISTRVPARPCIASRQCLSVLNRLIATSVDDDTIIGDACRALRLLSDGNEEVTREIVIQGMVPYLVHFIGHNQSGVILSSLRILGNIVAGNQTQTNTVLREDDVIENLFTLLSNGSSEIVKEAGWVLSNITCGSCENVAIVMTHSIDTTLINAIRQGTTASQREGLHILRNITKGGNLGHIIQFCQAQILSVLLDDLLPVINLTDRTQDIILVLEVIYHILFHVGHAVEIQTFFNENGRLGMIDRLQSHQNDRVYSLAHHISYNLRANQVGVAPVFVL